MTMKKPDLTTMLMPLKVVQSSLIPFKPYTAMMLFGVIIRRKSRNSGSLSIKTINHEAIHRLQALDFYKFGIFKWIAYYSVYLWFSIRLGYHDNPFEREAYVYESMNFCRFVHNREIDNWKQFLPEKIYKTK